MFVVGGQREPRPLYVIEVKFAPVIRGAGLAKDVRTLYDAFHKAESIRKVIHVVVFAEHVAPSALEEIHLLWDHLMPWKQYVLIAVPLSITPGGRRRTDFEQTYKKWLTFKRGLML